MPTSYKGLVLATVCVCLIPVQLWNGLKGLEAGCSADLVSGRNQGRNAAATKSNEHVQKNAAPIVDLPVAVKEKLNLQAYASKHSLPCYEAEADWSKRAPADTGLLYMKPFKTGSSTCSGMTIRMARNQARREGIQNSPVCRTRFSHGMAYLLYQRRDPARSFLWTNIREPTKRVVSGFFFRDVSRKKKEPTDANFRKSLQLEGLSYNYYLEVLSLGGFKRGSDVSEETRLVTINKILNEDYDFVGVTERMDESAVAIAMLRGIPLSDVLYVSAKTHGGYDGGGTGKCTYIVPSFVSSGVQAYLDSDDWQSKVKYDEILYKAANLKLDKTIEALGRERFDKNLQAFLATMDLVKKECHTVLPCNSDGEKLPQNETDCLWNDSGCSLECLDEMASRTGIDKVTY